MGGTWVHWFQPNTFRELTRYGMMDELEHSADYSRKHNYFTWVTESGRRNMSHEEEEALFTRALHKFMNIDGNLGKTVMPFPFNAHWNKDVLKWADLSVADRIAQIQHDLTEDERNAIETFVLLCSCGTRDDSSFLDFLRWWAAGDYNYASVLETTIGFKLKCGQSGFAIRFFEEALESGNLSYSLDTAVSSIDSSRSIVQVRCRDGRAFLAKRVICTVPLNVLNKVQFNPPLSKAKVEAAALKHVNQCVKLHAEIKDPEMRSWGGMVYPHNKLVLGVADGLTPANNTHCVFFGIGANHINVDENIDETLKSIKEFTTVEVERLVFHNWSKDEFAEGAWVWYRPGMEVKYLGALRERHGPVLFANSDWAAGGWRSFIDGAIESGAETALLVRKELRTKALSSQL
ncbi:hypothetical protein LTS17_006310 [Exophiala oligosperma]